LADPGSIQTFLLILPFPRADTWYREAAVLRGIYTGAAGMVVQQNRLDALSNNLANVDTTG